MCVCVYIYSWPWNVLFCNLLEVKVQYILGCYYGLKFCGIIWKLWYYGMELVVFIQFRLYGTLFVQNSLYGTLFVQTRLYGSLYIAATDCVQVDFSNTECMKVVTVEWLLWYAQVIDN